MKAMIYKFVYRDRSWWYYNIQENESIGDLLWYCGQRRFVFKMTKANEIAKDIDVLIITYDELLKCDGFMAVKMKSIYTLDRSGDILTKIEKYEDICFLMSQYPIVLKKSYIKNKKTNKNKYYDEE